MRLPSFAEAGSGAESCAAATDACRTPANQPLHLTAAASQFFRVQLLTNRRGRSTVLTMRWLDERRFFRVDRRIYNPSESRQLSARREDI
jgi:hypothetical protein